MVNQGSPSMENQYTTLLAPPLSVNTLLCMLAASPKLTRVLLLIKSAFLAVGSQQVGGFPFNSAFQFTTSVWWVSNISNPLLEMNFILPCRSWCHFECCKTTQGFNSCCIWTWSSRPCSKFLFCSYHCIVHLFCYQQIRYLFRWNNVSGFMWLGCRRCKNCWGF